MRRLEIRDEWQKAASLAAVGMLATSRVDKISVKIMQAISKLNNMQLDKIVITISHNVEQH
jgi:hypothetical protein